MVADPTKPADQRVNYRNALQGVYRMVRDEGASSLARGLAPNTVSTGEPYQTHIEISYYELLMYY